MEWVQEFIEPVLRHRREGHSLLFKPRKGEAEIFCSQCGEVVSDGDRDLVQQVYECVLQWPKVRTEAQHNRG